MPMVDTQLDELLHRLARVQPPPAPIISLYLNTQADERGRDRFFRFVQDELKDRVRGFRGHSGIKPSLERDVGAHRGVSAEGTAARDQRRRDFRLLGLRPVRSATARGAVSTASAAPGGCAAPVSAGARQRSVPALRGARRRHQHRAHPRVRAEQRASTARSSRARRPAAPAAAAGNRRASSVTSISTGCSTRRKW